MFLPLLCLALVWVAPAGAEPLNKVESDSRCPVCGMFVAKYDIWISQIRYEDGAYFHFDGVKDMMAFYHNPEAFNGPDKSKISEVWVKDYYTTKWLAGRQAFYVIGSDVHGPMGPELIPFATRAGAESFTTDHRGAGILQFNEITVDTIDRIRVGNRMKGGGK